MFVIKLMIYMYIQLYFLENINETLTELLINLKIFLRNVKRWGNNQLKCSDYLHFTSDAWMQKNNQNFTVIGLR